jgi:hypothetical protein
MPSGNVTPPLQLKIDGTGSTKYHGELLAAGSNAGDRILCSRDTSERVYENNGLHGRNRMQDNIDEVM